MVRVWGCGLPHLHNMFQHWTPKISAQRSEAGLETGGWQKVEMSGLLTTAGKGGFQPNVWSNHQIYPNSKNIPKH